MPQAISKDQNILGGEPVFRGTRVPFKVLTDYLEGGETLDKSLEQYPSVVANSPFPPSKKHGQVLSRNLNGSLD
jgi:uncharacterized protein (DUF433 family)